MTGALKFDSYIQDLIILNLLQDSILQDPCCSKWLVGTETAGRHHHSDQWVPMVASRES